MGKSLPEIVEQQDPVEIAVWPGISAGLPVLIFGVAFILANLLGIQLQNGEPWLLFTAHGIILLGVIAGWLGWFPNWSYAFSGMAVLFSLWWGTSTGGTHQPLAGPLAWSPLLAALALAILLARSLKPLLKFLQGILRDWSLASLGLYGVLPVAMYAAMSVMPPANAVLFQIVAVLVMAVGAGIAGLAVHSGTRGRVLLLAMSWSWIVVTSGVAIYWHGKVWDVNGQTVNWFEQVLGMSLIWVILAIIIYFPAALALLGRLARRVTGVRQAESARKP